MKQDLFSIEKQALAFCDCYGYKRNSKIQQAVFNAWCNGVANAHKFESVQAKILGVSPEGVKLIDENFDDLLL